MLKRIAKGMLKNKLAKNYRDQKKLKKDNFKKNIVPKLKEKLNSLKEETYDRDINNIRIRLIDCSFYTRMHRTSKIKKETVA
jgi:hypothetical protein